MQQEIAVQTEWHEGGWNMLRRISGRMTKLQKFYNLYFSITYT